MVEICQLLPRSSLLARSNWLKCRRDLVGSMWWWVMGYRVYLIRRSLSRFQVSQASREWGRLRSRAITILGHKYHKVIICWSEIQAKMSSTYGSWSCCNNTETAQMCSLEPPKWAAITTRTAKFQRKTYLRQMMDQASNMLMQNLQANRNLNSYTWKRWTLNQAGCLSMGIEVRWPSKLEEPR